MSATQPFTAGPHDRRAVETRLNLSSRDPRQAEQRLHDLLDGGRARRCAVRRDVQFSARTDNGVRDDAWVAVARERECRQQRHPETRCHESLYGDDVVTGEADVGLDSDGGAQVEQPCAAALAARDPPVVGEPSQFFRPQARRFPLAGGAPLRDRAANRTRRFDEVQSVPPPTPTCSPRAPQLRHSQGCALVRSGTGKRRAVRSPSSSRVAMSALTSGSGSRAGDASLDGAPQAMERNTLGGRVTKLPPRVSCSRRRKCSRRSAGLRPVGDAAPLEDCG